MSGAPNPKKGGGGGFVALKSDKITTGASDASLATKANAMNAVTAYLLATRVPGGHNHPVAYESLAATIVCT
jgi:hypothetical protein